MRNREDPRWTRAVEVPLARPQGRIEEKWSFDARSWESIRPVLFGPSRSSRLYHESRVKETTSPEKWILLL